MNEETVIVEAYGIKYVVDKRSRFIVEESYEPFMRDLIKLKLGDVFVDVGGHVGKYSFYAATQVGDSGLVIAIEPHPQNIANLKKGIELNGFKNVKIVEKACSNRRGKAFLLEYELSAKHEISDKPTKMMVEIDTLDHILQSFHIKKVNMVKIDVNGHEYQVIEGARNMLKNHHPAILMEVMLENEQKVLGYLEKFGYKAKIISQEKRYLVIMFK